MNKHFFSIQTFRHIVLILAFVVVIALPFIFAPRLSTTKTIQKEENTISEKLVIISPHWEGIRTEFERAFSEWTLKNMGHETDIEWIDVGGTSEDIRYVKSEFARSPGGINIDIFFGGGVDPYMQLGKAGLLERAEISEAILSKIPKTLGGTVLYDTNGFWYGTALSGFGIVYNKVVSRRLGLPVPTTWEDLARPEMFGWVGSGDPRTSGSVHMVYEVILQAYGWEKGWSIVVRMCGNSRTFTRAASSLVKDVATGELACGMSIDVYGWRQIAEVGTERMGFCLPEKVSVINPDSIAILKGAPHKSLANKFIEFVLSEEGQKLWCLKPGVEGGPVQFALTRIPIVPGLTDKLGEKNIVPYAPFVQWKAGFEYDPQKAGARWGILNDMIGVWLIDTHTELVEAWRSVKGLSVFDPRFQEFVKPPLNEQEMLDMVATKWQDSNFRAQTCTRWAQEARLKYLRIVSGKN